MAARGCILTVWQFGLYLLWQLGVVFGQNDKEGLYCDFMTIEGLYFDRQWARVPLQDNARVGDEFMRQIEPIAANVPYMTCPGNHEMK